VTSTVMPGHMRQICTSLETSSGKREGDGFGLCYSPEFIALGSVIHDFMHPDYALIGAESEQARAALESIYNRVHHAPKVCMNWVNAEIAKIAQNSYITMKITFANQLAQLCSNIPGANVDDVTRALGHDSRIGNKYMKGGTAFGGACFPRDQRALVQAAERANTTFAIGSLIDDLNYQCNLYILDAIEFSGAKGTVGILGLSFKPWTPVIEESASMHLIDKLVTGEVDITAPPNPVYDFGIRRVIVYDPLVMDEARKVLGDSVEYAESAFDCIKRADVLVIMTPDPLWGSEITIGDMQVKTIIDPWRLLHRADDYFKFPHYIPLGVGPREAVEA